MRNRADSGQDYLQEQVSSLLLLASRKPTPKRLALVAAALDNKFEGIQSAGLQVLGVWGDTQSRSILRQFLQQSFARPNGWAIRTAAIKALAPHLRSEDASWVLSLYFGSPDILSTHEVFPLVLKLPADAVRRRVINELRSAKSVNRQAAVKAIGNMAFPDKNKLLLPLLNDIDDRVRDSARALSGTPG
jgi:HEAT repeat protein